MHIQLIENRCEKGEVHAQLHFNDPDNSQFPVIIRHPHTREAEAGLEWYFEHYINEPYTAGSTIERTVREYIVQYGTHLFEQIFADPKAKTLFYKAINSEGYSEMTFEICGMAHSPEFQTIIWESLRDPAMANKPLAAWGVKIIRSSEQLSPVQGRVRDSPTLNLLIVTARPSEENDVNYRTIQRPLIDQLQDSSSMRINAVILRPGTYQALKNHLDEKEDAYYHIIHFDLHGAVLLYDELLKSKERKETTFSGTYSFGNTPQSFQVSWGRYLDMGPYKNKKAFLFFESEEKGVSEPWSAEEIADLISGKQTPVCILNACQSAKQDGDASETNLAKFIHERGVPVVVAMRYSVSTTAAAILMGRLYDRIFDNIPIDKALGLARVRLFDQKERNANFGYKIDLEDWALPVVYQSREVTFNFRNFTKEERRLILERQSRQITFPEPRFGFKGRDLDILKIEKLLSKGINHLLLRGMMEAGKSTLLQYLAAWWVTTNFRGVQAIVYLDFTQPKSFAVVLDTIAERIMDKIERKSWRSDELELRARALLNVLNSTSYGLIFDNIFELQDEKIRQFLSQIKGKSFVVYGSVNPEDYLKQYTFADNIYFLEGLDQNAAYELAALIVGKRTPHQWPDLMKQHRYDLMHLMELLAGFPSAMESVLPLLKDMPAPDLLKAYSSGKLPVTVHQ